MALGFKVSYLFRVWQQYNNREQVFHTCFHFQKIFYFFLVIHDILTIFRVLSERVRERAFHLIGRSYSSISLDTVVSMTGLSRDTVLRTCADRKWVLSEDGATVNPTPPTQPAPLHTSSEDQLFKLTEFVSFLEN